MNRRFLSTTEAAHYLNTTRGTLANLRLQGNGPPYVKQTRKVLYDLNDLEIWLNRQKVFTDESQCGG
jgi:hypothetical protein